MKGMEQRPKECHHRSAFSYAGSPPGVVIKAAVCFCEECDPGSEFQCKADEDMVTFYGVKVAICTQMMPDICSLATFGQ